MKTMVDMANGAVTGMVLKTYCKTCRGCTAARPALLQKCNAFRSRQVARARDDAVGDLVGSMPVEAAIRRKYGFVLMVYYSRASSVLRSRAKPEGPAKLEV